MSNQKPCHKLTDLLQAETEVIKRHLQHHKWYQHITDENQGVIDFGEKYGWIMREMYCGYACPERSTCGYLESLKLNGRLMEQTSPEPID